MSPEEQDRVTTLRSFSSAEDYRHRRRFTTAPRYPILHRCFSTSVNPRSLDPRLVDLRSVDQRSLDPRSLDPRSVDPWSLDPRSVDPWSLDTQSVDLRSVDPRSVDPRPSTRGPDLAAVICRRGADESAGPASTTSRQ